MVLACRIFILQKISYFKQNLVLFLVCALQLGSSSFTCFRRKTSTFREKFRIGYFEAFTYVYVLFWGAESKCERSYTLGPKYVLLANLYITGRIFIISGWGWCSSHVYVFENICTRWYEWWNLSQRNKISRLQLPCVEASLL